jgi:hypothetical protein
MYLIQIVFHVDFRNIKQATELYLSVTRCKLQFAKTARVNPFLRFIPLSAECSAEMSSLRPWKYLRIMPDTFRSFQIPSFTCHGPVTVEINSWTTNQIQLVSYYSHIPICCLYLTPAPVVE